MGEVTDCLTKEKFDKAIDQLLARKEYPPISPTDVNLLIKLELPLRFFIHGPVVISPSLYKKVKEYGFSDRCFVESLYLPVGEEHD